MTANEAIRFLAKRFSVFQFVNCYPVFRCGMLRRYPEIKEALVGAGLLRSSGRNGRILGRGLEQVLVALDEGAPDWYSEDPPSHPVYPLWRAATEKYLARGGPKPRGMGSIEQAKVRATWGL